IHRRTLFSTLFPYTTLFRSFAADGTKLLREAIAWWPGLHTVILSDGVSMEIPEGVRVVQVPEDVMASISPMQTPQGALFLCRLQIGRAHVCTPVTLRYRMPS